MKMKTPKNAIQALALITFSMLASSQAFAQERGAIVQTGIATVNSKHENPNDSACYLAREQARDQAEVLCAQAGYDGVADILADDTVDSGRVWNDKDLLQQGYKSFCTQRAVVKCKMEAAPLPPAPTVLKCSITEVKKGLFGSIHYFEATQAKYRNGNYLDSSSLGQFSTYEKAYQAIKRTSEITGCSIEG
jgi:hypothetical protein